MEVSSSFGKIINPLDAEEILGLEECIEEPPVLGIGLHEFTNVP
jgi:hypothetical protein